MDWIVPLHHPPQRKIYVEALTHNVTVFRDGVFGS